MAITELVSDIIPLIQALGLNYDYSLTIYLIILTVFQIPLLLRLIKKNDNYIPRQELKSLIILKLITFLICAISVVDSFSERFVVKEATIFLTLLTIFVKLVSTKHLRVFLSNHTVISSIYIVIFSFMFVLPFGLYGLLIDKMYMLNRFVSSMITILSLSFVVGSFEANKFTNLRFYMDQMQSVNCNILFLGCLLVSQVCYFNLIFNLPFLNELQASYDLTAENKYSITLKLVSLMVAYAVIYHYIFINKKYRDFRGFDDDNLHYDAEHSLENSNIVSIEKFYIVSLQD